MSNTSMEAKTHRTFLSSASGSILVSGLGIGMATDALLAKDDVTDITIIEQSEDVMALTAPLYKGNSRVHIVHADIKTWTPDRGAHWDWGWHDIWPSIDADNLAQMEFLTRKFIPYCSKQSCWGQTEVLRQYLSIYDHDDLEALRSNAQRQVDGLPLKDAPRKNWLGERRSFGDGPTQTFDGIKL